MSACYFRCQCIPFILRKLSFLVLYSCTVVLAKPEKNRQSNLGHTHTHTPSIINMPQAAEPDPPLVKGKHRHIETERHRLGVQQAAEEPTSSVSSLPSSIRRATKKARNTVKKAGSAVKKLTRRKKTATSVQPV
ncbi:uncharacterized protein EV420DRAFT_1085869 [Desarmillaria tabescens]|uniref:Secreted protein n=1 Tax=Armillaria tabescens TaxID=1929756 RepID=A0AA39MPF6_ARMTA|nr:uncharacterized protein EV420DRAFT_1085869 [Desarmillaria tabescens]KAK0441797.1 hypothetical protein EV420DRAFT_1085869 [Desarmillaria tabescens]